MSKLSLLGGSPTKTTDFPTWPVYDQREEEALRTVLESLNWWREPGDRTLSFEQEFAAFQGAMTTSTWARQQDTASR